MKTGLIYMYIAPNGKKYVGQTICFSKRDKQHRIDAYDKNSASYDCAFHRAIRKYGYDSFKLVILENNIPREMLDEQEIYWIKEMNSFGKDGYNMTAGGCGNLGRVWTTEMRKKASLSKQGFGLGHQVSEETRRKIGEKNKLHHRPQSEETRRKISEHNARAVAKPITFANEGVYHGKPFYPGLKFDSSAACAAYFGIKPSTLAGIKSGKYNKKVNMQIVEITQ